MRRGPYSEGITKTPANCFNFSKLLICILCRASVFTSIVKVQQRKKRREEFRDYYNNTTITGAIRAWTFGIRKFTYESTELEESTRSGHVKLAHLELPPTSSRYIHRVHELRKKTQ